MKQVNKYMCEHCHYIYDTADECKECESKHQTQIATIQMRYRQSDITPTFILIDWENGSHSEYIRN